MNYAELFDQVLAALSSISNDPSTPKAIQRACLVSMEKLDVIGGHLRRSVIQDRLDSLKKKPATVTPINKAQ